MRKLLLLMCCMLFLLASCTKKEIVQTEGKGIVSINMDLSSGVMVSSTRADNDFKAELPSQFTAYFVAAENTENHKKGEIVKKCTVNIGDNQLKIPDIKYNIYISNYDTDPTTESDIKLMLESTPESSDVLYLTKEDDNVIFHQTKTIEETLENKYAAVCIYNNSFTTGAQYNVIPTTSAGNNIYKMQDSWYYLYIKAANTNSTVWITGIPYCTGSIQLNKTIKPNYIYEYVVTDNTDCKFTVKVNQFAGIIKEDIGI